MTSPKPKRPSDPNQRAKLIVDIATGEHRDPVDSRDPLAVELGRRGGRRGGKARAQKLSAERRAEIAKEAAAKRWKKES